MWAVRKLKPNAFAREIKLSDDFAQPENLAALLPAFSAALPFLLLIMATLRLPLTNPAPVFGLALLLVVLLLGLAKIFSFEWLPAVALACVTALECAWHFNRFDPATATQPLMWYLIFFAGFALFPFVFLKQFSAKVIPWATAALAGLPQFFLVHRLVKAAYPNEVMGLLPAAFALPTLLSLVVVLKKVPTLNPARLTQLAFCGGVALFFITLVFPIQFSHQWITLGWALEGAALLWLFHRVPHPGLRLTGIGLLAAAFVRLALNPAVLSYHPRSATPILNWYLYTYGAVTVCLFAGARLLAPPRHLVLKSNVPPLLAGLGMVLAFLLLNIEIADYFSAPVGHPHLSIRGEFRTRHDVFDCLGAVRTGVARDWHRPKNSRFALRRPGVVERDIAQTVLPRPRPSWRALSHWRCCWGGRNRHPGLVRLPTLLRRGQAGEGGER